MLHWLGRVLGIEWGDFIVRHGRHEVSFPTAIYPIEVFAGVQATDEVHGCGQRPVDTITALTYHEGDERGVHFLLDVQSESVRVTWVARGKYASCLFKSLRG